MENELHLIQRQWHGSYSSYAIGFVFSLVLTATAFFVVMTRAMPGPALIGLVVGLGILQAIFQIVFFLHIGKEDKPYWETQMFLFMVLVLLVIVLGSLWIMYDLNHRLMGDMQ